MIEIQIELLREPMKISINENTRTAALNIHKDYVNFVKANAKFMLFAFSLFMLGNLAEYFMFNSQDLLSINQNVSQSAGEKPIMPSLSFFSWLSLLLYLVSYFFMPSLILWFNQNSNFTKDKKTRKANKINLGYFKTLLKTLFNYKLYLLILLLSFLTLFGVMMILRAIPELTTGLDLVLKDILTASHNGINFDINQSEAYKNYIAGIDSISMKNWILAGFEAILTAVFMHCVYFVSLPLLVLNKDIGVIKSLYMSLKSIVINWHVYLSVFLVSIAMIIATKSIENIFILSKILSVMLPTLLFPYFIILNRYLFKKT